MIDIVFKDRNSTFCLTIFMLVITTACTEKTAYDSVKPVEKSTAHISELVQHSRPMMGFSPQSAERERLAENIMAATPDTDMMKNYHYEMTRVPHHAGSEANYQLALYLRNKWEEFGYETEMFKYDILVPWPVKLSLKLISPEEIDISITEPPIPEDPDTYIEGGLPGMAAYVASGTATGELVYVNYGRLVDYQQLEAMGVSLEGNVAIVRYGGSPAQMRGMKVREAAKRGAVGVIVYSDPEDDGYVKGDVYPEGKWRPWTGIQRGSYLDVPIYPGDPLTPFKPSIPGVDRIAMQDAPTIQKIPVQPISYGEALKLLRHIKGPNVPTEWQGGLPLTYHIGPGPAVIEMHTEFDYKQRPVWNVFGKITGVIEPEKIILSGGHRDGWVLGARDPISGAVSLLETARGIAEAVSHGYRPRRSIVFSSWGGEDFFLLGSTEWGEHFASDIKKNVVAYLNRESYTSGTWTAEGSHSLEPFIIETSRDAPHPETSSLFAAWSTQEKGTNVRLGALGGGSDYMVFLDHLGVPSLSFGYGSGNGIYHSLYDTFEYYQRFGDPGYHYGVAQADMVGRLIMRLANAEVLPFDYRATANTIGSYIDELIAADLQGNLRSELRQMSGINAQFGAVATEANHVTRQLTNVGDAWMDAHLSELSIINQLIMQVERELTDDRGLWRRPWYRNLVYAAGYYEGYAAKTLPGVREAMEAGEWDIAKVQAQRLIDALVRATSVIDKVADHVRAVLPEHTDRSEAL